MNNQHDLEVMLDSHFPIITIETHEEKRMLELLQKVMRKRPRELATWSITQGIQKRSTSKQPLQLRSDSDRYYMQPAPSDNVPLEMLKQVKQSVTNTILVLLDFHPYLDDATIIRLLKEIALEYSVNRNKIILISHALAIPGEIQRLCASFELALPTSQQLEDLIREEAKVWSLQKQDRVKADKKSIDLLVRNLQGLTLSDARRLVRNAIYNDGAITHNDIPDIMKAKYELIGQEGVLSFEYDTARFSDIGGFNTLMDWLTKRKDIFLSTGPTKIDAPKGILLLGIQGCGKSLAAKAVAGAWGIPLLRLDFGSLYNKYFGETEKNIRESLKTAEVMSPCVLWMDEIEKGIAAGDYDSGTSRRVLASLLTWMAENEKKVFIVATANDIQSLPPELVRKGRMDEIFFVDLPDHTTRHAIFNIHIAKRGAGSNAIDINLLAKHSAGFSGSEIEQAVIAALYSSHARKASLSTQDILQEINNTQPLSTVMAEKIHEIRHWANGRTVSAN